MAYQEVAQDRPALPEYLARKDEGPMDDEEFHAVVKGALSTSVQFIDTEMSIERAKATEYYLGKPFGNEEDGRSQVVLTDVRDAVDGMLPSLLRVFFSSEHAVEFVPTKAETVQMAAEMTDYVRYVFEEDNQGFLRSFAVMKDGLVRKIGIFKWGWETTTDVRAYRMEGITDDELNSLAADDDVNLTRVKERKRGKADQQAPKLYDVDLTRIIKNGRARLWEIPPEEFIYNRQARSLEEALLVGHRTDKTRGQLLALGISEEDIDDHAGPGNTTDITLKGNAEEIARRDIAGVGRVSGFGYTTDPDMGSSNTKILYTEAWMTVDYDGDGIAELRKICCIGPTYYPIKNDPADERPFAIFTPYPEPHTLVGGSVADRTMDLQKISSAVFRAILDSASAAAFPRTAYVEGQASVADIMNNAIGAPIRERVTGAVRYLEQPFTAKELIPLLPLIQEITERRTGQNKGSQGLDDDALQSTGKEAVGAVLTASQQQIEMICRVFAEMTMKPMFKGLARLVATHQPRSRMVRLRGAWVDVDPRPWDLNCDVTVNIALGSTFTEKKVATLMAVAADQKDIISTLGMSNPLVTLPMFRNTRAKILELQGIKDTENYYAPLPPNWQPPPTPPVPDPNQQALEAEKEMNRIKAVKELAIQQDKLALEREKQTWEQNFAVKQHADDVALRLAQINAQFKSDITEAMLDSNIRREVAETDAAITVHDQLHDQALERDQQQHEQTMDQRAADTADMQAQQTGAEAE